MSCRIELTETEYQMADLNMKSGNFTMTLCGLEVRLIGTYTKREMPHPEKITYWAEISRIMT